MKYILAVYWLVMVTLGNIPGHDRGVVAEWFRDRAYECIYIAGWLKVEKPADVLGR